MNIEKKSFPLTYLVIKFSRNAKDATMAWFIEKVTGRKIDGGAELLIRRQPYKSKEGLVLHITASPMKFLQMAEDYELVKTDKYNVQREFIASQLDDFLLGEMHIDDLFSTTDRQTLIRHELDNLRALSEDKYVHGYVTMTLYEGKSIMQTLMDYGLIVQIYALHDDEILRKLGQKWFMSFTDQPIDDIRLYFGESIALYFKFLGFYTTALLFPMILGFIQMILTTDTLPYYCVFNVLWVIVFLEMWKRESNELAFYWGTINMTSLDEPQPNFRGKLGVDPITGKLQPQYPRWKTNMKMYCVSFPVVILCLFGGFVMMIWSFWAEELLKEIVAPDSMLIYIPSVVYTALVYILNLFYRKFATFLTDWENHRTQSQYDRHRVIKMVLFEFVNNFLALFYIAFIMQDMEMLKQQLATMLIILQAINHFQEALLPLLLHGLSRKIATWNNKIDAKKKNIHLDVDEDIKNITLVSKVPVLSADDPRIEQANIEASLDEYQGTYDDYLELFIQFGYVILFSSVYPLAACFAVINNILEIRADAFKLCKTCQRPMANRVKNIGAWQRAFEIIGAMSIMTNCGLLWLSPKIRAIGENLGLSELEYVFYFVLLEHCLLGIRYVLHQAIPERPEWVRIAMAKNNYIAKEALKKERAQKSSKMYRHLSVYGTKQAL